jgi:hypothetical protein
MDDCPYIPKELVKWLDQVTPVHRPTPSDTLGEILFKSGERVWVDRLIDLQAQQEAESNVS